MESGSHRSALFLFQKKGQKGSPTGIRTRVSWVKARYPNQLDYGGLPWKVALTAVLCS
jgi:hypothetical protein